MIHNWWSVPMPRSARLYQPLPCPLLGLPPPCTEPPRTARAPSEIRASYLRFGFRRDPPLRAWPISRGLGFHRRSPYRVLIPHGPTEQRPSRRVATRDNRDRDSMIVRGPGPGSASCRNDYVSNGRLVAWVLTACRFSPAPWFLSPECELFQLVHFTAPGSRRVSLFGAPPSRWATTRPLERNHMSRAFAEISSTRSSDGPELLKKVFGSRRARSYRCAAISTCRYSGVEFIFCFV